ncbi:MAG: hypothetical protein COA78_28970 [Blastopirellula sp.]|nr:MAG: hypothetical protein COA78_28970 [Blastopirellula sp.]
MKLPTLKPPIKRFLYCFVFVVIVNLIAFGLLWTPLLEYLSQFFDDGKMVPGGYPTGNGEMAIFYVFLVCLGLSTPHEYMAGHMGFSPLVIFAETMIIWGPIEFLRVIITSIKNSLRSDKRELPDKIESDNPYQSPNSNQANNRHRIAPYLIAMSLVATCGVFATVYFVTAIGLYFFVFGDTSSAFSFYAILISIPSSLVAAWLLSRASKTKLLPIAVTLVIATPCLVWFATAIVLHLFVFGDTSPPFSIYAILIAIPSSLVAAAWLLSCAGRTKRLPITITLAVTMPCLVWFVINLIRYGL